MAKTKLSPLEIAEKDQRFIHVKHSLIEHKLTLMRDKNCHIELFRRLLREAGLILCSEATRALSVKNWPIETVSCGGYVSQIVPQENVVAISVLRSGLAFGEAFFELAPMARVGHIGLYREKPGKVINYFTSIPSASNLGDFFILDPVIARSDTIQASVDILLSMEVPSTHIRIIALLAYRGGLETFFSVERNFGVKIYVGAIDEEIDEETGFLIPGLGDAGDRCFGTQNREINEKSK